jgi:amino acid adenylation domain-containing protein
MDLEQRIAQLSPAQLAVLERKLKKTKPGSRPEASARAGTRQKSALLSFSQERIWFLEQMEPETCIYNLPAIIPLRGSVSPVAVEEALTQIAARHSALRTRFVVKDDSPYQIIDDDPKKAIDFATIDLRSQNSPPILSQKLNQNIWVPFNLATGPLVRVRLLLQRNEENVLLLVMHHIISDGWSINIFTKEFGLFYQAAQSGKPVELPPVYQYVDYSIAQRARLEGESLEGLLSYWRRQLEDTPAVLELPLDRPRPARQSFRGTLHSFTVPRSSVEAVKTLCKECGVVPFMAFLSAFKVLLFRYTRQPRITVGTPIANRTRAEFESVIGFFTNTLVLSSSLAPEMTFRQLLAQVRETTLGAYEHQELPFEKLVSELRVERSLSHNPLFQVMFTFQNLPTETARPAALPSTTNPVTLEVTQSKFDLTLAMAESDDETPAVFEYASDLFDAATIERMAGHFLNILNFIVQHPDEQLAAFSFLSRDEQELILDRWNDTGRQWPEILPLHGRFERWVREAPHATAVIFRDESLTYSQLEQRAARVAAGLREQGVGPGRIVGICLRRSLEMVSGLFGILKSGAAYMPIEPDLPEDRIAYMLKDAGVQQVLTSSECLPVVEKHAVTAIALDRLETTEPASSQVPVSVQPEDVAYVIFTSGSTGNPKGVMVSHGAIDNRLQWMQERYRLEASDRIMQKTPFTFDVSVWEFFWPLSEGACLVVAEPERHKESAYLVDLIKSQNVTCLHFVPSMLQLFLCEDLSECRSLKRIICSGEALTIDQCRRLQSLPGVSAHNLYGPTEAAVDVTHWDCSEWRDQYLSVPIGRPIANTQIYILNEKLQPVPIGVPGELYIGGRNLAEGYLNKPDLTAKSFVPNPFAETPGARLYKTGDLARFRADGDIEYIGRIDTQVKLRGLRIELGEIESILRQYPGVIEAVAVVSKFDESDERLAAYIVPEDVDAQPDISALTAFAAKKLPSYMVPSVIVPLHELPLTPNGKLDRKRLPVPAVSRSGSESIGPANEIEEELLTIWRKFLKTDAVKTNDDFFALGGHSILATQVINSINGHYQLDVPVRLLFENPTVKNLARALSELERDTWLDQSRTAVSMLARSERRLLQTLDELTEEQLDQVLTERLDREPMTGFEDVQSLLSWVRGLGASRGFQQPKAKAAVALAPANAGSPYLRFYPELAGARAAAEHLYWIRAAWGHFAGGFEESADILRVRSEQAFESFVRETQQQLGVPGAEVLEPHALRERCQEMIVMAELSLAIASLLGPKIRKPGEVLD